jgi:hypothetical protein
MNFASTANTTLRLRLLEHYCDDKYSHHILFVHCCACTRLYFHTHRWISDATAVTAGSDGCIVEWRLVPSASTSSTGTTTDSSGTTSGSSSIETAAAATASTHLNGNSSANGHTDGVTANGESPDVTDVTVTEAGVTAERHSWLQHIAPPSKVLLCDDSAPAAVLQLQAVHGSTVGARTSMLCYSKQVSSCEH